MPRSTDLPPYARSLAGVLLAAREAVMAPVRPCLREAGLTDQQWRVLRVLDDGEPLDASGIAERASLYPPSVTRIVRELVDRRLLSRSTDEADRRRSAICITDEGRNLVRGTAERTAALLDHYGETFGHERLTRLIKEAHALTEALSRLAQREAEGAYQAAEGRDAAFSCAR